MLNYLLPLLWLTSSTPFPSKVVNVTGPIVPLSTTLFLSQLQEVQEDREILIKIASPGGSVFSAYEIVARMNELKAQGKEIICYVHKEAQSAAFMIFLACDKRFADKDAILMFHSPYMKNVTLTLENAEALLKQIKEDRDIYLATLLAGIPADPDWITKSFFLETSYTAKYFNELVPGFLTVVETPPTAPPKKEILWDSK